MSNELTITERYAEVAPEPILRLHRHKDGFISFAVERDNGEDFRQLVAIKASELETYFPEFLPQLLRDSYVAINSDWRLRSYRDDPHGYPMHRTDKLRHLNACYVDIDHYKRGLKAGEVIGQLVDLQDSGVLPYASMIVRSGRGTWLLWFLRDPNNIEQPPGAFIDQLDLYSRVETAIIERLLRLGADPAARDACRYVRIPGSWNSDGESTVQWMIQGRSGGGGYIYTLQELADQLHAIPTRRHGREVIAHYPRKRRGWVALFARRLRDFNSLRAQRGGFSLGVRNHAAKLYAWLLRCNGTPGPDVWGLVNALGAECHPKLSRGEIKTAVEYSKRMRAMQIPDRMISDWLDVTRGEAEALEKLPPATRYRTAEELAPATTAKPRQTQRAHVQARRAAIQEILAESASVPTVRAMAKLTAAQGFSGNQQTIYADYLALGVKWERTKASRQEKKESQGSLFTACNIARQYPAPATQGSGGGDGYEFWRDRTACEGLLA